MDFTNRLPTEMLERVFKFTLQATPNRIASRLTLVLVSRRWYQVVLITPDFWTSIHGGLSLEGLQTCLSRANPLPISLSFQDYIHDPGTSLQWGTWSMRDLEPNPHTLSELFRIVKDLSGRLETLRIRLDPFPTSIPLEVMELPDVLHLDVSPRRSLRHSDRDELDEYGISIDGPIMERLRSLSLEQIKPDRWWYRVKNLVRLHLGRIRIAPSQVATLLCNVPQLESLSLYKIRTRWANPNDPELPPFPECIPLLSLKSLKLINLHEVLYPPFISSLKLSTLEYCDIDGIPLDILQGPHNSLFDTPRAKLRSENQIMISLALHTIRIEGISDGTSFTVCHSSYGWPEDMISALDEWLELTNRQIPIKITVPGKRATFGIPWSHLTPRMLELPTLRSLTLRGESPEFADVETILGHTGHSSVVEYDFEYLDPNRNEKSFLLWIERQRNLKRIRSNRLARSSVVSHCQRLGIEIHTTQCCEDAMDSGKPFTSESTVSHIHMRQADGVRAQPPKQ